MGSRRIVRSAGADPGLLYVTPGSVGFLGDPGDLTHYAPAGSGLPGAGVAPPGAAWQSYGLRIDETDVMWDRVWIHGGVYWTGAGNMSLTRSRVLGGTGAEFAPIMAANTGATPDTLITVQDTDLGWMDGARPPYPGDNGGVWQSGDHRYLVERTNLFRMPQGIDPPANGSIVRYNWIHDLIQNAPDGSDPTHIDGIFCQGGSGGGLLLQGNYVDCPHGPDDAVNSAIFLQTVPASPIPGIRVIGNYLHGAGFGLRNEDGQDVEVTDNTFGGDHLFGEAINVSPGTIATWARNVDANGDLVADPS